MNSLWTQQIAGVNEKALVKYKERKLEESPFPADVVSYTFPGKQILGIRLKCGQTLHPTANRSHGTLMGDSNAAPEGL